MKKANSTTIMKKKWSLKTFRRYYALSLMAVPAVLYLLLNNYLPLLGLSIAFKKVNYVDGIWKSPWCGWDNFRFLFLTPDAYTITRNTICYNLVFILLGIPSAVFIAILLNELRGRFLPRLYQSSLIIPYLISFTVVGYIVYAFLSPDYGIANLFLEKVLGREAVNWYAEAAKWPPILVFVNLWKNCGYSSVMYLAAIMGIDATYYEAAMLDGASRWQKIRYITLPSIQPVIIMLLLLNIGRIFYADFGLFYQTTMNSGLLHSTTNVIDTYVYRALLTTGDIGMSAAAGCYQSVIGFVLVLGANLLTRKYSSENALF